MDEAKRKEVVKELIPIQKVQKKDSITLPILTLKQVERPANVHYSVPISKMRKLAKELGSINKSFRDVGLESFEYTYNDLVGEE